MGLRFADVVCWADGEGLKNVERDIWVVLEFRNRCWGCGGATIFRLFNSFVCRQNQLVNRLILIILDLDLGLDRVDSSMKMRGDVVHRAAQE